MKPYFFLLFCLMGFHALLAQPNPVVKTHDGWLEGRADGSQFVFLGVPYARPPIGDLRWRAPQSLQPWSGIRKALAFGPRPMQLPIYKDMQFRSSSIEEDCLYLNIWTKNTSPYARQPVIVYFHGGGLSAGDGSEYRYDGSSMASKGVVFVTLNYRLGVFGFLAHPALTQESPKHQSGNYGFLDQQAALKWVQQNIAQFGGDPERVTIAGQSAGSISVSAHMASPGSKGLFRYAIGQSGSILASLSPISLAEGEQRGLRFASLTGAPSLQALRSLSAQQILEWAGQKNAPHFAPVIDGYFLPHHPIQIYASGLQQDVPLLAGWTSAEVPYPYLMGKDRLTNDHFEQKIRELYPEKADEVLKFYPLGNDSVLEQSATDLASDRFIAYGTWKWIDLHSKTNGHPVYRYLFSKKLPRLVKENVSYGKSMGAPHSSDIEYALGNLSNNSRYQWSSIDSTISETFQNYFVNFARSGDPNGRGLPVWTGFQASIPHVMVFDQEATLMPEKHLKRYVFMDQFYYP